ncbi:MAG: polysaccharide biosynthesis/export family protein [Bryobacteraceae bacterium]
MHQRMTCLLLLGLLMIPQSSGQTAIEKSSNSKPDNRIASHGQNLEPGEPAQRREAYLIRPGDELDIKFFYNPELNERVVVRPDGRISLQLVHEVEAAGLPSHSLKERLERIYSSHLAEPQVSILVRHFSSQRIYVDGEVERPGLVALSSSMTLSQAIAQSGGLRSTAHTKQILLLRRGEVSPVAMSFDLTALQKGRAPVEDPVLHPEDVIFVSRTRVANVNRWMDQYIRRNIPISTGLFWTLF